MLTQTALKEVYQEDMWEPPKGSEAKQNVPGIYCSETNHPKTLGLRAVILHLLP